MDPATIGISIIAAIAGGAALGFYALWRHSEELQRGFRKDAQRYRLERDYARAGWHAQAEDCRTLLAKEAQRRADLAEWGRKGRQIQLEKRRAA